MKPLVQPAKTLNEIEAIASGVQQAHAYLIRGAQGVGKHYVANYIAAKWLGSETVDEQRQDIFMLDGRLQKLGIDEVRSLQQFLQLRTVGARKIRRVVLIYEAQFLTTEAQNALLKTLEEPPADTRIILTSSDVSELKLTIVSRVQSISLHAVPLETAQDLFTKQGFTSHQIEEAYKLSQGLLGLMSSLLNNANDHPLVAGVHSAKNLLGMSVYERLLQVDELAKDKETIKPLLSALLLVAQASLRHTVNNFQPHKRWQQMIILIEQAQSAYTSKANSKLLLTELFINL